MATRTRPWGVEVVLGLAFDDASARAAERLTTEVGWAGSGSSGRAVWGLCQGSRAKPYQVGVELAGPAYRCSCPSRKVPCKHALGLLMRWSRGAVVEAEEPEWVAAWLTERVERAEPVEARRREGGQVVDPEAAERRAAQRADRVASGVAELEVWLTDQVRHGLAGLEQRGYAELSRLAARMVDAQAPGLAGAIRRAAGAIGSGHGWPSEVLDELATIYLTVRAHGRLDQLPEPLAESVKARIGWTVPTTRVLAEGERVADAWRVLGRIVEMDERLTARRVWLLGERTGRRALLLSFAPAGQALDPLPGQPGDVFEAELAFYPGALPLRALVVPPAEESGTGRSVREGGALAAGTVGSVADGLAAYAEGLGRDPWLERWPVVLAGVRMAAKGDRWALVDAAGDGIELWRWTDPWCLLAVSAGQPVTVAGELSRSGFRAMTCWDGDRPVVLG